MDQNLKVANSSFLVTGGTGSFGTTVLKRLLDEGASFVRVLSRDETKQFSLLQAHSDPRIQCHLGDIRDFETVRSALFDIEYVFHAAALKQVPFSEKNPFQYVQTNIMGSHNLLLALSDSKVKSAVFLSTDKAAHPVNAMGMTKALMEKLVRSESYRGKSNNSITRYGNVIGSRGSVIPYFISQLKSDGEICLTDESMTRFMMSLEESVDLVFLAMGRGISGDLFVKKASAATLRDILSAIEILLDKKAKKIRVVGPRPGEKHHETLLTTEEKTQAIDTVDYFRVPATGNPSSTNESGQVSIPIDGFCSNNTKMMTVSELVHFLSNDVEIQKLI